MNKSGYLLFGALAAGLGLWGFWLGRSSVKPAPPQVVTANVPAAPSPAPASVPEEPAAAPAAAAAPIAEPAPVPASDPVRPRPAKAVRKPAPSPATRLDPAPAAPKTEPAPAPAPAAPAEDSQAAAAPPPPPPPPADPSPAKPVESVKVFKPEKDYETANPPKPREAHTATIPAGTLISVRLREALSSERSSPGDTFLASLDQPLIVDGFVIAEKGSSAKGHIVDLAAAGRVKGRALLAVELKSITTSDGQRVDVATDTFRREAESGVKKDAAKAGVMAAIGAAIGAIAGGGKGAAIGAGVGGAAGAGTVLATKGQEANLPAETRVTFRLKNPVTITEKLN